MAKDLIEHDSSEPVLIKDEVHRYLLGLVKIRYVLEDRRPDCAPEDYWSKYKLQITVDIGWGWCHLGWVLRSHHNYDYLPFKH